MNVKVKIEEIVQEKKGSREIKLPIKKKETVDTLLIKLSKRVPEIVESILDPRTGGLEEGYNIQLNGRSIKEIKGLHTGLKNKDVLKISSEKSN